MKDWEKRFDQKFNVVRYEQDGMLHHGFSNTTKTPTAKEIKHFLATALEEEREKVIEEVRELIAYSSFEMTPGGRPMKRTCSVEEAMRQLEKDVAKLNQLKEEK